MSQKKLLLSFSDLVKQRHSVRKYKIDYKIPKEDLHEILEMAHTAPSAWNLQHWRVIVIQDSTRKEALISIANGQQQVADASAVFVILGDLEANLTAEAVYRPLVDDGFMSGETYAHILKDINQVYEIQKVKARDDAFLNTSLFAMQLMLAAKSKGYDTGPIGGFQADRLIDFLHIPKRFIPILMIPIGVSGKQVHPTVRLPLEEILINESF
ncbi:nitroreductase family protein [Metabacillus fastidiosus]|uniref:nitroreductase family protein n=1 Tax=Metabacillus fastidiosus TaxID=1458 RepID=UPI002E23F668|nr:nitroreductase family protein [Metabacillus fastidiosus]